MDKLLSQIRELLAENAIAEEKPTEILKGPGVDEVGAAAKAGPTAKQPKPHPSRASGKVQTIGDKAEEIKEDEELDAEELEDITEEEIAEEDETSEDENIQEDSDLSEAKNDDEDEDEDDEDEDSDEEDEDDEDDKEEKGKKKFPFFKKKNVKEQIDQHVDALFNNETSLSEEFKTKAKTIFEAAVLDLENSLREQIVEEFEQVTVQLVENYQQTLADQLDEYLNYIAEEWLEQNALAVEQGIKNEIAESFISGLRELFETHSMTVPEESDTIVEELSERVAELEEELSNQINKNIELVNEQQEAKIEASLLKFKDSMSDIEFDKFSKLAEEISFESVEDYENKLQTIKENYFVKNTNSSTSKKQDDLTPDDVSNEESKVLSEEMSQYVKQLEKLKR